MNIEKQLPPAINKEQILYFLGVLPFFVIHSISLMFFQLRKVDPEHLVFSAAGFFSAIFFASCVLYYFEHKASRGPQAAGSLRAVMLLLLLSPALFSFTLQVFIPGIYSGNLFINAVQPFVWALLPPFAFFFFFHPALEGSHSIHYGLATAAGHLFWAFLVPVISLSSFTAQALLFTFETHYLPFLNLTRCFFALLFAFIIYTLTGIDHKHAAKAAPQTHTTRFAGELKGILPLITFMAPLSLCFFLYGMLEYTQNETFAVYKLYGEYKHLGLAVFYLSMGFLIHRKGENIVCALIVAVLLCSVGSVLASLIIPDFISTGALCFVLGSLYRVLVFAVLFAAGMYALRTAHRALGAFVALTAASTALVGDLFARHLASFDMSIPFSWCVFLFGLACSISIPFVYRFFPLPPAQADAANPALPSGARINMEEKLPAFAKAHRLGAREGQILLMLLQGLSSGEMAQAMQLKESTIRTYTQSLLKKTGTNSRLSLVAFFLEHGLEPYQKHKD